MSHIQQTIHRIYGAGAKTEPHRLLAWERCYQYFAENKDALQIKSAVTDKTPEEPMLHLAAYLANWGMYQGDNNFLLKTDYTVYNGPVKEMLKKDYNGLWAKDRDIDDIAGKTNERKEFAEALTGVSARLKEIWKRYGADNLLVTKMMMATYGSILAYDRFVAEGLEQHGISPKFGKDSICNLLNFYLMNKEGFDPPLPLHIDNGHNTAGRKYPIMRKMDMYFFVQGGTFR